MILIPPEAPRHAFETIVGEAMGGLHTRPRVFCLLFPSKIEQIAKVSPVLLKSYARISASFVHELGQVEMAM